MFYGYFKLVNDGDYVGKHLVFEFSIVHDLVDGNYIKKEYPTVNQHPTKVLIKISDKRERYLTTIGLRASDSNCGLLYLDAFQNLLHIDRFALVEDWNGFIEYLTSVTDYSCIQITLAHNDDFGIQDSAIQLTTPLGFKKMDLEWRNRRSKNTIYTYILELPEVASTYKEPIKEGREKHQEKITKYFEYITKLNTLLKGAN